MHQYPAIMTHIPSPGHSLSGSPGCATAVGHQRPPARALRLGRAGLLPDKKANSAHFSEHSLLFPPTQNFHKTHASEIQGINQDALNHAFPVVSAPIAKISSQTQHPLPTLHTSALPSQVELNFSTLLPSSRSSSLNTAAIPGQDFPVFTTDSQQSTWLPTSSLSLPASSAQLQQFDLPPHQQDFVLYDQPIKRSPSRSVSQPSANGGVNQTNQQHRNQQLFPQQPQSSPSLQNQRVANIIQATGHQTTSSVFSNRFHSSAQNPAQFYASSAPSSSAALNLHKQNTQNRHHRPPVPLFSQSTGSIPQAKMNLQDLDFDDFTSFEGGASTTAYSSPALPTVFDLSGTPGSNNMGTVSPHDLLITEPFMSAPNSTALTTLTSPSVFDGSPSFDADNFECSPNFGTSDYEVNNPEHWFPLFPQTSTAAPAQVKPEQSPAEKSEELEGSEPAAPGHRRRSSGTSPPSGRHSSVSGVSSRRRDKPLPPIIVEDPHDTVAMKRARNTLAARKSRERKAQRLDELEERIEKLTQDRDYWKNKALALGAQE